MAEIEFTSLYGDQIQAHYQELAELRITVFREFPYLYDGSLKYEQEYLQVYANSPRSMIVLMRKGAHLIGATTCIPLSDESEEFQKPFMSAGIPLDQVFYFGESLILKEFRGGGTGKTFFERRERHAQKTIENLKYCAFCAVNRPIDHSHRPKNYRPLDEFWQRMGYQKREDMVVEFPWKDLDEVNESKKQLTFWLKSF